MTYAPATLRTTRGGLLPAAMRPMRSNIGFSIPVDHRPAPMAGKVDAVVGILPARSMVVNATGLGKGGPGSPLTDALLLPRGALIRTRNAIADVFDIDIDIALAGPAFGTLSRTARQATS